MPWLFHRNTFFFTMKCVVFFLTLISDKMDKQVLSSSRASEDVSRYSVGILKGGTLIEIISLLNYEEIVIAVVGRCTCN